MSGWRIVSNVPGSTCTDGGPPGWMPSVWPAPTNWRLRIPRSTLYEFCRRRHDPLPRLRLGRSVRFERREVEAWLSRQRSEQW